MSTTTGEQPAKEAVEIPSRPAASAAESSKPVPAPSGDKPKLSTNELKELKKAEKAARRAKSIEQKTQAGGAGAASTKVQKESTPQAGSSQKSSAKPEAARSDAKVQSSSENKHKQAGGSHQSSSVPPKAQKQVLLFNHLPERKEPGVEKVVHQDVKILGLQMIEYVVCGSNARLVAMLTVFKTVIKEYKSPENQALTRHLIPQVLSPQISHLSSCRPLSVSQGNAIRWLKLQISTIDVNTPEDEAKEFLCTLIDEFIRDKSTLAHEVIAEKAAHKIKDGDVVLTYAQSRVVEKTIKRAWAEGKRFEVIVIDNSPLHEGKKFAASLASDRNLKGMRISFGAYLSVSHYIEKATKVFLGAHAMMSNGYLYSRSGTSGIALEASTSNVPVIVLCESVKFSDKAPLTTFDLNEIAPVEEMFEGASGEGWSLGTEGQEGTTTHRILRSVEDVKGMNAYNLMYDLTPAGWINMVISEHGAVPPTSVPVLNRLHNEANEGQ